MRWIKERGFTPLETSSSRVLARDKELKKSCWFFMGLVHNQRKRSVFKRKDERFLSLMGFTLIELMLVIIIIGALVAMVMPRLTGRGEQARASAGRADIQSNIATALKLYELDNGNFPTTEEGLEALLSKPASASRWNGPYLEKKPIDPWNREYKYKSPGEHRTADYDLYSQGKDGVESSDDINNWE